MIGPVSTGGPPSLPEDHFAELFTKEKISTLCDPQRMTDEEWWEIPNLCSTEEKEKMETLLKDQRLAPLLERLKAVYAAGKSYETAILLNTLHTILGIRAGSFEEINHVTKETIDIFNQLARDFPNFKFIVNEKGRFCIVNEEPLEQFDPRNYLTLFSNDRSISTAFVEAVATIGTAKGDQALSYILGYSRNSIKLQCFTHAKDLRLNDHK